MREKKGTKIISTNQKLIYTRFIEVKIYLELYRIYF